MKFLIQNTDPKDPIELLISKISTWEGPFWKELSKAYRDKKWYVVLRGQKDNVLLFNIVGESDFLMIKMGKEFGFPRGFPLVMNLDDQTIEACGFFEKFENDDKQSSFQTNIEDIISSEKEVDIQCSIKYSGFLSCCFLTNEGGKFRFHVFSKNSGSTDSPYVIAATKQWSSLLDENTIEKLYALGIRGIWGECIDQTDQVHGYGVNRNTMVITGLSYEIPEDAKRPNTIGGKEMAAILFDFPKLLRTSATSFKVSLESMEELEKHRDTTTIAVLQRLFNSDEGKLACEEHKAIVGSRPEGLIFRVTTHAGVHIFKYKFAPYTLVTMCVRHIFTKNLGEQKKLLWIENYLTRWVVDETKRGSFRTIIYQIINLIQSVSTDTPVAPWIIATDEVFRTLIDSDGLIRLPEPTEYKDESKLLPYLLGKKELDPPAALGDSLSKLPSDKKRVVMPQFHSFSGSLGSFLSMIDPKDAEIMATKMDAHFRNWRDVQKKSYEKNAKVSTAPTAPTAPTAQTAPTAPTAQTDPKSQKAPKNQKAQKSQKAKFPQNVFLSSDEKTSGERKTFIVQVGPTGSGKTWFVVKIMKATRVDHPENDGNTVVSADHLFEDLGKFDPDKLYLAHRQCLKNFITAVCRGDSTIILSNTNTRARDFRVYVEIAYIMGYDVRIDYVDSFQIGLYEMEPEDAWTALSTILQTTDRDASWQGRPTREVFFKQFKGIFDSPIPFESGSLATAIKKPFLVTSKTSANKKHLLTLTGGNIAEQKRKAMPYLISIGVDQNWIAKCFHRDEDKSHITLASSDTPLPAFEKPDLSESDLSALGIGRVEKDGEVAYFVVIECPPLQDALKKAGLPHYDLHITLAFQKTDVHEVSKGPETVVQEWM